MRHDIRLLYLCGDNRCPVPVSVRLPTGSCRQGCYFCCKNSWRGKSRYALKHVLTRKDFLRLWQQIIFNDDFRFVWPQRKIKLALKKRRVLRFVREDLFEPTLLYITKKVLKGCCHSNYGLLVKTSSVNVRNFCSELKAINHCVVFSITDLLKDYREKVQAVNACVRAGLNVTLSLKPIFEYNAKTEYILSSVSQGVLGIEVGWLYGQPDYIPRLYLNKSDYKVVNREKQYRVSHLKKTVINIERICNQRNIPVRYYFSSVFHKIVNKGACCFVDKTL